MGYFLPEMARAGAATDWRTLAALVLTLFTSEFYYLLYALQEDGYILNLFYFYRLVTNVVLAMSIILMVLFSTCAILAGRTIRGMLAQRISVVQWDKSEKYKEVSWVKFEDEIMESWLLARVCNPQYVIARSVLISGVGLVATICIVFLAILQFCLFWIDEGYHYYKFGFSMMAWALETVFILIGETVICCRWFTAVVYFPKFYVEKEKKTCPRLFVEDFWTRSISELIEMYNLPKWCQEEQLKHGRVEGLVLRLATKMKIHYLFYLLKPLQIWLILFCKCCFFVSELVFRFKFVWRSLRGINRVPPQRQGESEQHGEILRKVCMPRENWENLWTANEKTMKQAKDHFSKNKEKGNKCDELFEFIRPHLESTGDGRFVNELESFPLVAKHFPDLDENCTRMTALSLLIVIMRLLPLHMDVNKLEKAIEAYRQSLDVMSFVDNSDPQGPTTIDMFQVIDIEADRVGVAVYKEFQSLLVDLKKEKRDLKKLPNSEAPCPKASEIIKKLVEEAKEKLKEQGLPITEKERQTDGEEEQTVREEYCDSRDWSAIAASYSKYRVCKLIHSRHFDDEDELIEYLYSSLSDVLGYCVLRLPYVMVNTCRKWAVEFEEQKIWDAMYTAGKFVGVMKKGNLEAKANFLQPYKDSKNKETHTVMPSVVEMQPMATSSLSIGDRAKQPMGFTKLNSAPSLDGPTRTTEEPSKEQESWLLEGSSFTNHCFAKK